MSLEIGKKDFLYQIETVLVSGINCFVLGALYLGWRVI